MSIEVLFFDMIMCICCCACIAQDKPLTSVENPVVVKVETEYTI